MDSCNAYSMVNKENNFAFIDSQNLYLGVQELGWRLDNNRFRKYLFDKYDVRTAYLFIGYLPENQSLYKSLQQAGYVLIFKSILIKKNKEPKGNVDADLVLQVMIDLNNYDKAVIVSSDGDFQSLVQYLDSKDKLKVVLSPNKQTCSVLLERAAKSKIDYMNNLKKKLEYHTIMKKHR